MEEARSAIQVFRRHAEVCAVLKDARFAIYKPLVQGSPHAHLVERDAGSRSRRVQPLSRVLAQQFSPRAIQALVPRLEAFVDHRLQHVRQQGAMDVIAELAYPLPLFAMSELLGLPLDDMAELVPLFAAITAGHDLGADERARQRAHLALMSMSRWVQSLLARRRPSALMDAILQVAAKEDIGPGLVSYWCSMLLYAGSTTTKDFLANAIGALVETPEQAALLVRRPEILDTALEELLRHDGPVRCLGRIVLEDLVIGDLALQRGQVVHLMLGEANRDPERFDNPQVLDLCRNPNPHIAFGYGVTHCLGAQLARLEGRIVLAKLLPLLPVMRAVHSAAWTSCQVLNERASLQLRLG